MEGPKEGKQEAEGKQQGKNHGRGEGGDKAGCSPTSKHQSEGQGLYRTFLGHLEFS